MRRSAIAPLTALLLTALVLAATAAASQSPKLPGFVIARSKASGKNALVVAHGQVDRPTALYARLTGKVKEATILVECLVGQESTPRTFERRRAALYRFTVVPDGADVCHVTATVFGKGPLVAELRAVR